jgi:hypothetical protein
MADTQKTPPVAAAKAAESDPRRVARVMFPEPGFLIERGNRKTMLEGLFDPRTATTTILLPGGDELLVHVSQAKTRLKRANPKDSAG